MSTLRALVETYGNIDCRDLGVRQLSLLREGLKQVNTGEINSANDGKQFIELLRKFREALAENDKLKGENYPQLLNSLLSVGEDGLYSNSLRFIFELIQNVDDCEFEKADDCKLDMRFDFNKDEIVLTYNEKGFSPFNVFAITGIAEAAKNISAAKNEIGEKGIGFKSVFGVAKKVLIRSGWFSFELYKENFTIPVAAYHNDEFFPGTQMTLFVGGSATGRARDIYKQIRDQYCQKTALFKQNPLLFLNKLTSLKFYFDGFRSMQFNVSRAAIPDNTKIYREDSVKVAVNLQDYENGFERKTIEEITCFRYSYPVVYSQKACQSRYGENTRVGTNGGKHMLLQAVIPCVKDIDNVGKGGLYSFLPTQLSFTVPIVCHAPFKLDASREFVDPQDRDNSGGNLWFNETSKYLAILMDYVYSDLAKIVKQDIAFYLPHQNESLFASNNGKERCLSSLRPFRGSHYLELPLFEDINGCLRPASDIFCFDAAEEISDPIKVSKWIETSKSLYLVPAAIKAERFGIKVERDINNRLFRRAFFAPLSTNEIIEYLERVKYDFSEKQFPSDAKINLSVSQIESLLKHEPTADILLKIANEAVRKNARPKFSIVDCNLIPVSSVLYVGFELNETPRNVEKYMEYCKGFCICVNIPEGRYLPCFNAIVISADNPLASFAAFCYDMDSKDTFAIRIKLREASNQLNLCVENNSGTAAEYIRDLRNIRLTVKDSLGITGYKNYIDLILRSGTDRMRFIKELLQNADDCNYPHGNTPTFSLHQSGNSIITEYNESGFTRANIRSITAIGESTKNRLLKGELSTIGEKGVGFKTVFAIASEVKVYSGEYNFALRAEEPTIPRWINGANRATIGTRMEIVLKERSNASLLSAADILELCLCLRQLRKIHINNHDVSIVDSDVKRIITIDKRPYVFSKYIHHFVVTDENALKERENGARTISPNQQIVCFVPEKSTGSDYPLYSGLPTKHKIRIPMAIDAPYELTTSREEIETDCIAWNDIVRKEMYNSIVKIIHARKQEDRASALRFARFRFQISGNQRMYVNDLADSDYINKYDYLKRLRSEKILPTFDRSIFASVEGKAAYKYPEAATILIGKLAFSAYGSLHPSEVIDPMTEGVSKEQKERIDVVFNALACENAPFEKVFPLLRMHAETLIGQDDFRNYLYEYLQEIPEHFRSELSDLKIIPVYGRNGGCQYISWVEDEIFVKKGAQTSTKSYWVLNELLLPKAVCEKIFDVNINEMNFEYERSRYQDALQKAIRSSDLTDVYDFLLSEFTSGSLHKNDCLGTLLQFKELVPLKNELGEITDTELFLCDQPSGYFDVEMLQRITVNKECYDFAEYIQCRELSSIHYEDIDYYEQLTADDIEALTDDYFKNQDELLRGFYRDGYLSDELLSDYDLEYIGMGVTSDSNAEFSFPEKPVRDRLQLKRHVKSILSDPVKILPVKVERTVLKGQRRNGDSFDINGDAARNNTLQIYTPEGANKLAFCQMCHKLKPYMLMEVNNLELNPKYYFHQTRVALCLECSKRFEVLRGKESIRKNYLRAIRDTKITSEGKLEIQVGHEETLTFTATHLAEIQEILKEIPE